MSNSNIDKNHEIAGDDDILQISEDEWWNLMSFCYIFSSPSAKIFACSKDIFSTFMYIWYNMPR